MDFALLYVGFINNFTEVMMSLSNIRPLGDGQKRSKKVVPPAERAFINLVGKEHDLKCLKLARQQTMTSLERNIILNILCQHYIDNSEKVEDILKKLEDGESIKNELMGKKVIYEFCRSPDQFKNKSHLKKELFKYIFIEANKIKAEIVEKAKAFFHKEIMEELDNESEQNPVEKSHKEVLENILLKKIQADEMLSQKEVLFMFSCVMKRVKEIEGGMLFGQRGGLIQEDIMLLEKYCSDLFAQFLPEACKESNQNKRMEMIHTFLLSNYKKLRGYEKAYLLTMLLNKVKNKKELMREEEERKALSWFVLIGGKFAMPAFYDSLVKPEHKEMLYNLLFDLVNQGVELTNDEKMLVIIKVLDDKISLNKEDIEILEKMGFTREELQGCELRKRNDFHKLLWQKQNNLNDYKKLILITNLLSFSTTTLEEKEWLINELIDDQGHLLIQKITQQKRKKFKTLLFKKFESEITNELKNDKEFANYVKQLTAKDAKKPFLGSLGQEKERIKFKNELGKKLKYFAVLIYHKCARGESLTTKEKQILALSVSSSAYHFLVGNEILFMDEGFHISFKNLYKEWPPEVLDLFNIHAPTTEVSKLARDFFSEYFQQIKLMEERRKFKLPVVRKQLGMVDKARIKKIFSEVTSNFIVLYSNAGDNYEKLAELEKMKNDEQLKKELSPNVLTAIEENIDKAAHIRSIQIKNMRKEKFTELKKEIANNKKYIDDVEFLIEEQEGALRNKNTERERIREEEGMLFNSAKVREEVAKIEKEKKDLKLNIEKYKQSKARLNRELGESQKKLETSENELKRSEGQVKKMIEEIKAASQISERMSQEIELSLKEDLEIAKNIVKAAEGQFRKFLEGKGILKKQGALVLDHREKLIEDLEIKAGQLRNDLGGVLYNLINHKCRLAIKNNKLNREIMDLQKEYKKNKSHLKDYHIGWIMGELRLKNSKQKRLDQEMKEIDEQFDNAFDMMLLIQKPSIEEGVGARIKNWGKRWEDWFKGCFTGQEEDYSLESILAAKRYADIGYSTKQVIDGFSNLYNKLIEKDGWGKVTNDFYKWGVRNPNDFAKMVGDLQLFITTYDGDDKRGILEKARNLLNTNILHSYFMGGTRAEVSVYDGPVSAKDRQDKAEYMFLCWALSWAPSVFAACDGLTAESINQTVVSKALNKLPVIGGALGSVCNALYKGKMAALPQNIRDNTTIKEQRKILTVLDITVGEGFKKAKERELSYEIFKSIRNSLEGNVVQNFIKDRADDLHLWGLKMKHSKSGFERMVHASEIVIPVGIALFPAAGVLVTGAISVIGAVGGIVGAVVGGVTGWSGVGLGVGLTTSLVGFTSAIGVAAVGLAAVLPAILVAGVGAFGFWLVAHHFINTMLYKGTFDKAQEELAKHKMKKKVIVESKKGPSAEEIIEKKTKEYIEEFNKKVYNLYGWIRVAEKHIENKSEGLQIRIKTQKTVKEINIKYEQYKQKAIEEKKRPSLRKNWVEQQNPETRNKWKNAIQTIEAQKTVEEMNIKYEQYKQKAIEEEKRSSLRKNWVEQQNPETRNKWKNAIQIIKIAKHNRQKIETEIKQTLEKEFRKKMEERYVERYKSSIKALGLVKRFFRMKGQTKEILQYDKTEEEKNDKVELEKNSKINWEEEAVKEFNTKHPNQEITSKDFHRIDDAIAEELSDGNKLNFEKLREVA